MLEQDSRGILLPERGGFVGCPYCSNRKLLRREPTTEVSDLPVLCRTCKRELLITIRRGQRPRAQSPN